MCKKDKTSSGTVFERERVPGCERVRELVVARVAPLDSVRSLHAGRFLPAPRSGPGPAHGEWGPLADIAARAVVWYGTVAEFGLIMP